MKENGGKNVILRNDMANCLEDVSRKLRSKKAERSKYETGKNCKNKFETEYENLDSEHIPSRKLLRIRSVSSFSVSSNKSSSHANSDSPSPNYVFKEYRNIDIKQEVEDYYSVKSVTVSSVTSLFHSENCSSANVNDSNKCRNGPSHYEESETVLPGECDLDVKTSQSNVISSSIQEHFTDTSNNRVVHSLNETRENCLCDSFDDCYPSISLIPSQISHNKTEVPFEKTCLNVDNTMFNSEESHRLTSSFEQSSSIKEICHFDDEELIQPMNSIDNKRTTIVRKDYFKTNEPTLAGDSISDSLIAPNESFSTSELSSNLACTKNRINESAFEIATGAEFASAINGKYSDSFHTPSTRVGLDVIPLIPRKGKLSKSDFYKLHSAVKEVPEERGGKNKSVVLTEAAYGKAPVTEPISSSPQKPKSVGFEMLPEKASTTEQVPTSAEVPMNLRKSAALSSISSVLGTRSSKPVKSTQRLHSSSTRVEAGSSLNSNRRHLVKVRSRCFKSSGVKSSVSKQIGKKPSQDFNPKGNRRSLTRFCTSCEVPLYSGSWKQTKTDGAKNRFVLYKAKGTCADRMEQTRLRREKMEREREEKIRLGEEKRKRRFQEHEERLKKIENAKIKRLNNKKTGCDVTAREPPKMDCTFLVALNRQCSSDFNPVFFPSEDKLDRKLFMKQSVVLTDCMKGLSENSNGQQFLWSTSSSEDVSPKSRVKDTRPAKYHFGRKRRSNKTGTSKIPKPLKRKDNENPPMNSISIVNSTTCVKNKGKGDNLKTSLICRNRSPSELNMNFNTENLGERGKMSPQLGSHKDPKLLMNSSVILEDVLTVSDAFRLKMETPKNHHEGFWRDPKLSCMKPCIILEDVVKSAKKLKPLESKERYKEKRRRVLRKNSETTSYELTDSESNEDLDWTSCVFKKAPQWAKGIALKHALLQQCYEPPNVNEIFGNSEHETIDLDVVFNTISHPNKLC